MPTQPNQIENERCCRIAGWGRNETGQAKADMPEILQDAAVPIISNKLCREDLWKDHEIKDQLFTSKV